MFSFKQLKHFFLFQKPEPRVEISPELLAFVDERMQGLLLDENKKMIKSVICAELKSMLTVDAQKEENLFYFVDRMASHLRAHTGRRLDDMRRFIPDERLPLAKRSSKAHTLLLAPAIEQMILAAKKEMQVCIDDDVSLNVCLKIALHILEQYQWLQAGELVDHETIRSLLANTLGKYLHCARLIENIVEEDNLSGGMAVTFLVHLKWRCDKSTSNNQGLSVESLEELVAATIITAMKITNDQSIYISDVIQVLKRIAPPEAPDNLTLLDAETTHLACLNWDLYIDENLSQHIQDFLRNDTLSLRDLVIPKREELPPTLKVPEASKPIPQKRKLVIVEQVKKSSPRFKL